MGSDLGICLRQQLDARAGQFLPQLREVLDDAVVDDGDMAVGRYMGMRVLIGGAAVESPNGVSDPGRRRRRDVTGDRFLEIGEFPRPLARPQLAVRGQRNAGGVVPAVLEPTQTRHHDVQRRSVADVSDDSHMGVQSSARATATARSPDDDGSPPRSFACCNNASAAATAASRV